MWQRFCNWLLYKHLGWTAEVTETHPDKFIICLAPHTSNWDFPLGQLYAGACGMKSNFLMKKEWFFFPLGIPKEFKLCITPEGTRSPTPDWKKGFYFIALKAGIPILLYGVDYEKRLIKCTKTIIPSGDLEADMREIKLYFKDFKGKKPENFTIGDIS